MNVNVYMEHTNYHTKTCVFTAPDTHSAYRSNVYITQLNIFRCECVCIFPLFAARWSAWGGHQISYCCCFSYTIFASNT